MKTKLIIFFIFCGLLLNFFLWGGPAQKLSEHMRNEEHEEVMEKINQEIFEAREEFQKLKDEGKIKVFSVTSDGKTMEQWIKIFESRSIYLDAELKEGLRVKNFTPTKGITTEVVVLQGKVFEDKKQLSIENLRVLASKLGLESPSLEIACLVRDKFIDQKQIKDETGVYGLTIMNEPFPVPHTSIFREEVVINQSILAVFGWGKNEQYFSGINPEVHWKWDYDDKGYVFVNL